TYRYFYYDALYKDMLPPAPEREAALAELNEERAQREGDSTTELRRGRRMDSHLYFQDLWTTCSLKWFNTNWTPLLVEGLTAPHLVYADVGGQEGSRGSKLEEHRKAVHDLPNWLGGIVYGSQTVPPLAQRQQRGLAPADSPLVQKFEACFPPPTRPR